MAPQPTVLMEHVTVTWPGVPEAVSGQTKRTCLSPAGEPAAKRLCLGAPPPPPQESALFYWRCFAEERSRAYNHTFGSGMAGPDFSDIRRQAGEAAVTGPPLEEARREPSKQRRDRSRHGSGKVRKKRTAIQAMVRPLKRWLVRHRHNPYPSREEKLQLGETAGMNLGQVSTWFANARRRLKQVVAGELLPWQERVRLYNSCVKGNAELLSLSSDDSVWNDDGKDDNRQEGTAVHDSEERIELNGIDPADHDDHGDLGDLGDPGDLRESGDLADPSTAPVAAPTSPSRGVRSPPPAAGSPKYKKKMLLRYLSDTERYSSAADADDEASGGSRGESGSSEGRPVTGCELTEPRLTAAEETEARGSEATEKEGPRVSADGCDVPSASPAKSSQERNSPPRVASSSVPQRSEVEATAVTPNKSTTAESAEAAAVNGSSEGVVPSRKISVPATVAPDQQKTPKRPAPEGTPSRPAKRPAVDPAAPRPRKRRPPAEQGDSSAAKRRLQFDESASKRPRLSPPSAVPCYPGELVVAPPSVPVCGAPAVYPGLDLSLCQPPQPQLPLHQYQQQLPQRQHQQHQQHPQESQHLQQEPQQWEQYPSSMTLLPWVPVWAAPGAATYWDGAPALAEEAAYRQVALPAPPAVWECWPSPSDGRPAYLPLM